MTEGLDLGLLVQNLNYPPNSLIEKSKRIVKLSFFLKSKVCVKSETCLAETVANRTKATIANWTSLLNQTAMLLASLKWNISGVSSSMLTTGHILG